MVTPASIGCLSQSASPCPTARSPRYAWSPASDPSRRPLSAALPVRYRRPHRGAGRDRLVERHRRRALHRRLRRQRDPSASCSTPATPLPSPARSYPATDPAGRWMPGSQGPGAGCCGAAGWRSQGSAASASSCRAAPPLRRRHRELRRRRLCSGMPRQMHRRRPVRAALHYARRPRARTGAVGLGLLTPGGLPVTLHCAADNGKESFNCPIPLLMTPLCEASGSSPTLTDSTCITG